ncbi:hemerythrin domain-containing protein [Candidatus Aminicenantes bacterium AH-873-B07]|jgi:hemerythrin-like domain-containing protein|nr:hemerythrin domain-containing protein [Candidatus Aminicenantes bacterium AH-873-B07]
MKPTEILKNEHRIIEKMLSVLEGFLRELKKRDEFNINHAEEIIDFFEVFADKCHHGKEEDMLFPQIEKAGVPIEGGPIGVMLFEHTQGRNFVKGMSDGIKEKSKEKFIENAENYISFLKDHIYKEDNILYNIADTHIPEENQKKLLENFEKFEKERIGKGVHEKYHDLVYKLGKIYIKNLD